MNLFKYILFLYFFTLHADQLHVNFLIWNIRLNNILSILLFLFFMLKTNHLYKMDRFVVFSLLSILLSLIISTFLSSDFERSVGYFYLGFFTIIFNFILIYEITRWIGFFKTFELYVRSFFLVGLYASLQLIFSILGYDDPFANQRLSYMVRPNAFAYEPSFYALYMVPIVFFYNYSLLSEKPYVQKSKIFLINVFYLISTSASTVFAYIFFMIFFWKRFKYSYKYIFVILIFILITYSLFQNIYQEFFFKFFTINFYNNWSFHERWIQIINSIKVFRENPIFGTGLGGVGMYIFKRYMAGADFLLRASETNLTFKSFDPMNVLTEILSSQGIVGLLVYSFFIGLIFYYLLRLKKSTDNAFIGEICTGFIGSLFVLLFVLQFSQGIFRTYIWVFFAMVYSFTRENLSNVSEN